MANPFDQFDKVKNPQQSADSNPFDQFDAVQAEASQGRSIPAELARQVGLAGRYAIEGVAAPVTFVADAAKAGGNLLTAGLNKLTGVDVPLDELPSDQLSNALTNIGLPNPENATERVVGSASRAVVGTGVGSALANSAKAANPYVQRLLEIIGETPATQAASAAIATGAADTAKEQGASPLEQMGVGVAAGVLPVSAAQVGTRAAKDVSRVIGNMISPLTKGGQRQIAGRILQQNASNPSAVVQNLDNIQQYIPDSPVTTGEAAMDTGLMGLQRGFRNKGNNPFSDIESQQNTARSRFLADMAGTEDTIQAAKKARESGASSLRDQAFENYNMDPRTPRGNYKEFAAGVRNKLQSFSGADFSDPTTVQNLGDTLSEYGFQLSSKVSSSGKSGVITASKTDPVTGAVNSFDIRVGRNPLPKNVKSNAIDLVGKKDGYKLLADKIVKAEPLKESVNPNYAIGIAQRRLQAPEGNLSDVELTMRAAQNRISNALNIGNPEYAYALRRDLANDIAGQLAQKAGGQGMDTKKYQRMAAGQLTDILESLDTQIEKAAPGYKEYMKKYAELSKPINQMETLQDIQSRVQLNAAPDVQSGYPFLSQPRLTQILKDDAGDLAKTLTPDQIQGLRNLESDMTRSAALNARNVRPTGSDTVANANSQDLISNFLADRAAERIPLGIGQFLKTAGRDQVNELMIEAFRDPKLARELLLQLRPELKTTPYSGAMIQKLLAQTIGSMRGSMENMGDNE